MEEGELQKSEISRTAAKRNVEGNFSEGLVGIGIVALCIIGLAHVMPTILLAIATIAAGVALAFEAATIASRYNPQVKADIGTPDKALSWGGMSMDFLAGIIGVVLGVLALIGVAPMVLIPVAGLVFGATLLLNSSMNARLATLEKTATESLDIKPKIVKGTDAAAAGVQVLVGLGVITFSILSLVGVDPIIFGLIGILGVGVAAMLSSFLIGGRTAYALRHSMSDE